MITIKSPKEIELMREACRVVRETLDYVGKNIRAGMTTKDVDDMVNRYIISCGAYPSSLGYCGYPASSCVSVNEVVVHGIPSDRVILDGDIVSVDITAEKNGFNGDAARTFMIGNVSEEKRQLVKVTEECFFKAVENLGPGTPLYEAAARKLPALRSEPLLQNNSVYCSYFSHDITPAELQELKDMTKRRR